MLGTSRVVATVLASVLVVGQVWAQPTPAPTPAEKQKIQDLVKQAIAKSQAGDHAASIELYQKAYAVAPLPTLLSNIGAEYQLGNKPVEALKSFCQYLEKDPAGPLATYATAQAKLLQAQLTNAAVDDNTVCKPPKAPPPPPPPDGDKTGGGTTGTTDLTTAQPAATDPGKTLKTAGLIVGGAGVVSVGLGIYFGIQAKNISDDISSHTDKTVPWRSDILAYQDEGQRDEYLQIACLVVGGLMVVGGAVLYVKGRSKSAAETTLQPTVTPGGGGGMVLSGSF